MGSLKRNYCWRLTLKAWTARMPPRWWVQWAQELWRARQWPRLRRAGIAARLYHHQAATLLGIPVDAARRRRRFGSEIEARRSFARSHNAGLARRIADGRERIAELQRRAGSLS
jgi:hypothetical protein